MKRHLKGKFVHLTKNTKSMVIMDDVENLFNYYSSTLNKKYLNLYKNKISQEFYKNINNDGYFIIDMVDNNNIMYYINMDRIKDIIKDINDDRIIDRIKKLV